jgi:serine/threonine protein kinase
MSFAALRRLRRRFGVSNAAKIAEASRYLHAEMADRLGSSAHVSIGSRIAAILHAAGLDSSFGRDLHWATALGERSRGHVEPSDADVEKFFDTVERLFGSDLAEPVEPRELVGRVVGDRYRIEALVGEGAAGVVYRARHVETDAPVAVKVLHPSKVLRREVIGELEHPRKFWEELVARFRREAKAAANVRHPGIVSVFDFGAEGSGFYQAMEFLTGETLRETIAREAPMPLARACKLAFDAAVALDAAHTMGVVHRDLKPANLFLCKFDWGEQLKVLDFGIAKMVREAEEEATRLTETGVFLGTYRYASPEQCLGERVTTASDVYSLGVILFEMLTGRPPFDGPSSVLAIRHATAPAPRVDDFRRDVPEALSDLVNRALDKLPSRRPAQGGVLAAALEPFVGTRAVAAAPLQSPARPRRSVPADALIPPDGTRQGGTSRPRPASSPGTMHAPGMISQGSLAFANQLVDELIQMNGDTIKAGRATKDIYRRLHDTIEMLWSLHASKFPTEPRDHFFEQLVERVAGGDMSLFGPGFPDTTTQRRRRRKR